MSSITSINDLKGKSFRLKEILKKDEVMGSNNSVFIRSTNNFCSYYYGNEILEGNEIWVTENSQFKLNYFGDNIYSFYYNTYYGNYGNKPRIIKFNEFDSENIEIGGWLGANITETYTDKFIRWWNYNTEEVNLEESLSDIANSVRKISSKTEQIPFTKLSYELEESVKGYTKVEGTLDITENGKHDVSAYEEVNVSVSSQEYLNYLNNTFGNTFNTPEGATRIVPYMFVNNSNIITFNSSSTLETIETRVFENCENLVNVDLNEGLKTIGLYAFQKCVNLKTIAIPLSVTSIGNYAFNGCSLLENVNIPDGITIIQNYCFGGCKKLKSITIPASVKIIQPNSLTIGDASSEETKATIYMESPTPPNLTATNAIGTGVKSIVLLNGGKSEYLKITNWNTFADIITEA